MEYAHTTACGDKIFIARTKLMNSNRNGVPGQIVILGQQYFTVTCGRGNLLVYELRNVDEDPYDIADFQEKYSLVPSLILGR